MNDRALDRAKKGTGIDKGGEAKSKRGKVLILKKSNAMKNFSAKANPKLTSSKQNGKKPTTSPVGSDYAALGFATDPPHEVKKKTTLDVKELKQILQSRAKNVTKELNDSAGNSSHEKKEKLDSKEGIESKGNGAGKTLEDNEGGGSSRHSQESRLTTTATKRSGEKKMVSKERLPRDESRAAVPRTKEVYKEKVKHSNTVKGKPRDSSSSSKAEETIDEEEESSEEEEEEDDDDDSSDVDKKEGGTQSASSGSASNRKKRSVAATYPNLGFHLRVNIKRGNKYENSVSAWNKDPRHSRGQYTGSNLAEKRRLKNRSLKANVEEEMTVDKNATKSDAVRDREAADGEVEKKTVKLSKREKNSRKGKTGGNKKDEKKRDSSNAMLGDVPWQVLLEEPDTGQICGGAILNLLFILTGARCVENFKKVDPDLTTLNGEFKIAKFLNSFLCLFKRKHLISNMGALPAFTFLFQMRFVHFK